MNLKAQRDIPETNPPVSDVGISKSYHHFGNQSFMGA